MFMFVAGLVTGDDGPAAQVRRVNYRWRDLRFRTTSFGVLMTAFTGVFRLDHMRQTGIRQPGGSCDALVGRYANDDQHRVGRPPVAATRGAGTEAGGRAP